MDQYVGLDVSLKETFVCVVDACGEVVCENSVGTTPETIAEFIEKRPPGASAAVREGPEQPETKTRRGLSPGGGPRSHRPWGGANSRKAPGGARPIRRESRPRPG